MDKLSAYIQKAVDAFAGSPAEEYIITRGISKETAQKYNLGYMDMVPANDETVTTDALLIPTSQNTYVMRSVDEFCAHGCRYRNSHGNANLFNVEALCNTSGTVFVTEGALDALSIIECAGEAMALNSVAAIGNFLDNLSKHEFKGNIVVAMDQDEAGRKAAAVLEAGLKKQNISYHVIPDWGGYKDANELLMKDKMLLKKLVTKAKETVEKVVPAVDEQDQKLLDLFETYRMNNCIANMLAMIEENAQRPRVCTGFNKLDAALEGGYLPGLHLVAAMSSLGKTTFVLQMVANIAKQGHDVIFYSLEMSRLDLFAKNISRHGFELDMDYRRTSALSTSGILSGVACQTTSQSVKTNFQKAVKEYSKYADKLVVVEGVGNIGAGEIKDFVENYIRLMKRKPVVVIDYIQLLHPVDARLSDKQNMDCAIKYLKQLAAAGVVVIAISSLNRQSYDSPVSLSSLKETGNLEYSAETVFALDFEAMYDAIRMGNPKTFDLNAEKEREVRHVLLTILKNRNGSTGKQVPILFYPKFNYFSEKS